MYQLLDCGNQVKIERFGDYILQRPCPQALWSLSADAEVDASFDIAQGEKGKWVGDIPTHWTVESPHGLQWKVEPNEYGNIGLFPEHWTYAEKLLNHFEKKIQVLSAFSYSGSSTVPLVNAGHRVTVVDSSKSAMNLYTKNLELNELTRDGQRLMLDDVNTFMAREKRRGSRYDGLIIDAPSYGRGIKKNQIFSIEKDFISLLELTNTLMSKQGKALITLHSPRFTPLLLEQLAADVFGNAVEVEEIFIRSLTDRKLPSGYAIWVG